MKQTKGVPILIPFLILVSALFIGILIFAYYETKKANPQMIEQRTAAPEVEQSPLPYDGQALT